MRDQPDTNLQKTRKIYIITFLVRIIKENNEINMSRHQCQPSLRTKKQFELSPRDMHYNKVKSLKRKIKH